MHPWASLHQDRLWERCVNTAFYLDKSYETALSKAKAYSWFSWFPVLERELVYETAVVARCWCGATLTDLINYKEHQAAFINLTSPGLATEDFSFQVFASLCSPQKQVPTKPSSPFPSPYQGAPVVPLILLEALKSRALSTRRSWIFIRGRGPAACAAPGSWEQLKGRASCAQGNSSHFVCWADKMSCLETSHCACVGGALPRRMDFSEAGPRSCNSRGSNLPASHLPRMWNSIDKNSGIILFRSLSLLKKTDSPCVNNCRLSILWWHLLLC